MDLNNKNVFVTGATGLIGKSLVKELLLLGANVIALVRDESKAIEMFGEQSGIRFVVADICDFEITDYDLDYIIHAASITSSKAFVEQPVDVIDTALSGTKRVLSLACENDIKGMVYLSSMEVYGTPKTDEKISESHSTDIDTMQVRSSYPESKRMCESLCMAYNSQYNVPVSVARLTQTFGPGVKYDDGRVFAEFARCVIENRDIILKTKGETKRCYLHLDDAIQGILTLLDKGQPGLAYNIANEETYCSIYEMASFVVREFTNNSIKVVVEEDNDSTNRGFAPTLHMNLDTDRIKQLGFNPRYGLKEMYASMIESMKNDITK